MVDPLDLFSEDTPNRHSSQIIRPSSPIQETETLRELKLIDTQKALLKERNRLKEDVQKLESQWNEMRENVEVQENNEEDDAIFELLIQKANEEQKNQQEGEGTVAFGGNLSNGVEDDLDRFSAMPSKDWGLRTEYLQRFYPNVRITNHSSKVSLEYNDPLNPKKSQLLKTISFTLSYPKRVIRLDVQVKLIKIENIYKVYELLIEKDSSNKLNTVLIAISQYFSETKNVNAFLYTINKLYNNLVNRHEILTTLREIYGTDQSNIFQNQFEYENISLSWDFVFKNGTIQTLINVNDVYNDVFKDLVEQYDVQGAIDLLIKTVYPAGAKEAEPL